MIHLRTAIAIVLLATFSFPSVLLAENRPSSKTPVASREAAPMTADAGQAQKDRHASEVLYATGSNSTGAMTAGGADKVSGALLLDKAVSEADKNPAQPINVFNDNLVSPVEKNIHMFSSTMKGHFSTWLSRSGKYIGVMKGIFREKGLPEDLVFLALIESGFNPMAYSWAKASGPWQFIKGTAKRYGLNINPWVDERRDPIKSTKAAAEYLTDLYDMFGTWSLAMASYNAGEGSVSRAVMRNGTMDFWELRNTGSLATETKDYVPKFLAAKMIAQNPDAYGFGDVAYEQPMEFDEVVLDRSTSLGTVAKCCGVTTRDIKDLNPELIRWCTPPNTPGYTLRIPKGTKDTFLVNYTQQSEKAQPGFAKYTVRRGDTISKIAHRFGVEQDMILDANNISKIKRGQRLIIPVPDASSPEASTGGTEASADGNDVEASADTENSASAPVKKARTAEQGKKTYMVKKGDTIKSISKKFKVSVKSLRRANSLNASSKIKAGQKLIIPSAA